MKRLIRKIFGFATENTKGTGTLSEFFTNVGSTENKKIIEQAAKKASNDQKELVERYDRKFGNA